MEQTENYITEVVQEEAQLSRSPALSDSLVVYLQAASFGLYSFYWFYRNWRDLRGHVWGNGISPGLRTLGLFIPILNIVLLYRFFRESRDYIGDTPQAHGLKLSPGYLTLLYLVGMGAPRAMRRAYDFPEPLPTFVGLALSIAVLYSFQNVLNIYWQEQGQTPRNKFTLGEIVVLVLGCFLWSLVLLGSLLEAMAQVSF